MSNYNLSAFYTSLKQGKTGLTVTVDIFNTSGTKLVNAGSATEIGDGVYKYQYTNITDDDYWGIFKTTDATVDMQHLPALAIKQISSYIDTNVGSRASGSSLSLIPTNTASGSSVAAIPTNPLLTTDSRLNVLDVNISTRASGSSLALIPTNTASGSSVAAIPTNPLLTNDSRLNTLDVNISTRSSASAVALIPTNTLLTNDSRLNTLDVAISSRSSGSDIANNVWNEPIINHMIPGTSGSTLFDVGSSPSLNDIVVGVWNYALRTLTSGSFSGSSLTAQQVWEYSARTLTDIANLGSSVWTYPSRSLTTPIIKTTPEAMENQIIAKRGDTFTASFSGLGNLSDYSELYFTVKLFDLKDQDANSILQVVNSSGSVVTSGLLYVNGQIAGDPSLGTIMISDPVNGEIVVEIAAKAMAQLSVKSYTYDVEIVRTSGGVNTLVDGEFLLLTDVTRAV